MNKKQTILQQLLEILELKENQHFTLKYAETGLPLKDVECRLTAEKGLQFLAGTKTWVSCHEFLSDIITGKLIVNERIKLQ